MKITFYWYDIFVISSANFSKAANKSNVYLKGGFIFIYLYENLLQIFINNFYLTK